MSVPVHSSVRFTTENTKHHEGARRRGILEHRDLTNVVIGLAIEVHRIVSSGLLESVYGECLAEELEQAGIPFQRQVTMPVVYKGKTLPLGFQADLLIRTSLFAFTLTR